MSSHVFVQVHERLKLFKAPTLGLVYLSSGRTMTIDCAAKLTLLDILQLVGNKLCYITRLERRANFQLDRNELFLGIG